MDRFDKCAVEIDEWRRRARRSGRSIAVAAAGVLILVLLFSVFVIVIAALHLVLDFDFIEKGAERGAPKYMEWYDAFGLLVTLVWLYLEIVA